MLTASRITRLRQTAQRALPDVCTVQRATTVSDGGGGTTTTWADHLTGVPCRLSPVGGGEQGTSGGRIADESSHIVTVAAGTDVTERDRLVVGATTYEVTLVRDRGAWELTRRLEAKEAP